MKTNPYKGFNKLNLIPITESTNQGMLYEDFSMKAKLERILHELGMGYNGFVGLR